MRTGEFTVVLPIAAVTVQMENGKVIAVTSDDPAITFNVEAVRQNLGKGWAIKDALISARDTRRPGPNQLSSNLDATR